jgi:glycine cleavage system H protein
VKAAADVYAPLAGDVVAVNRELEGAPERINRDPYGAWLFKLRPDNAAELGGLLSAVQYQELVESEEH